MRWSIDRWIPSAAAGAALTALAGSPLLGQQLTPPQVEVEVQVEDAKPQEGAAQEQAQEERRIEVEVEAREAEADAEAEAKSGEGEKSSEGEAPRRNVIRRRIRRALTAPAENSVWIGVAGAELPAALASQLKLSEGVLVEHVAPDSPAAKGGVQPHDILVSFNGQPLKSVGDLAEAVKQAGEKESDLVLVRGGERQTLQVTPSKGPRPEVAPLPEGVDVELRSLADEMRKLHGEKGPAMLFLGPGILPPNVDLELGRFPGDLSVTIKKEGDQPARITVKRGDDKWEVTSEELEKLPQELRPHVERFLGGDRRLRIDRDILRGLSRQEAPDEENEQAESPAVEEEKAPGDRPLRFRRFELLDGPHQEAMQKHLEEMRKHMEQMRERMEQPDGMKELREELENLRREVEKLRNEKGAADEDGANT